MHLRNGLTRFCYIKIKLDLKKVKVLNFKKTLASALA